MKNTRRWFVEREVALELLRGQRQFPWSAHPLSSDYVKEHKDSFVEIPLTAEGNPHALRGKIPKG
jgi:hypothetical protein